MTQKITFQDQIRGFPLWQVFVLGVVRFAEPIAFTSLFPYVFFMVRDFHIAPDESQIPRYVGYLSACFSFCQFLFSVHWSRLSDRIGRKKVIIMGLLGTCTSMILFGFSTNFWMALFSRSLLGCLNGNVAVIRTMLGEIATDTRHAALAFSIIPLLWQLGCVVGPLSGYLVDTDSSAKFPYALSNVVVAACLIFSTVFAILFLEETHHEFKKNRDWGLELGNSIRRLFGFAKSKSEHAFVSSLNGYLEGSIEGSMEESLDETTPLVEDAVSEESSIASGQSIGPISRRMSQTLVETYSVKSYRRERNEWKVLFFSNVFRTITSNLILSLHCLVLDEFLPVFASSPVEREDENDPFSPLSSKFPFTIFGGLGFSSKDIGSLLSSTGIVGVFIVIFLYPYIDRTFDGVKAFKFFLAFFPFIYAAIPYVVFTLNGPMWLTKGTLYAILFIKTLASSNAFPQILLLIHRCSPAEHRAFINGTTMSLSALGRFLGPMVWGLIMSFAESVHMAWIMWWSLGGLSLWAFYLSLFIEVEE